jgi:hypothetical protein
VAATLIAPSALAQQQNTGATTTVNPPVVETTVVVNTPPPPVIVDDDSRITNVLEEKGKGYYFLGVNYRANIIPAFIINLFVDQGPNIVATSTFGLSFDYRKDHFSIIPGVNFSDYTMSSVLFLQKGKDPSMAGDWGVVQSQLKAIYATVDLLWSVPLVKTGQVDFEFGFAVGLGGVFGNLYNTWVSNTNTGGPQYANPVAPSMPFYQCNQTAPVGGIANGNGTFPSGCNTGDHQSATISKTGPNNGYREPNWFDSPGGSVPTIFPWLELPVLGLRIKPIKEFEMRLQGGFSITGFFFNFAAYYGFENPKSTPH